MEIERERTRRDDVEKWLNKWMYACCKTDYGMLNEDNTSFFMVQLKVERACFDETLVTAYHTTRYLLKLQQICFGSYAAHHEVWESSCI
jgi:hypothetical protein